MYNVLNHLAASGSAFHENAGPHLPIPGPTLAKLEMITLYASSKSSPIIIMINHPKKTNKTNKTKNANTVLFVAADTPNPLTLTGKTAFGWRICLNSFLAIRAIMTARIHLIPPEVEPAHAPQ